MNSILSAALIPVLIGTLILLQLPASSLRAEHQPETVKAEDTTIDAAQATQRPSLWKQDYLTGDWGGTRAELSDKGVAFGLNYIGEVFGNPSGGIHQGAILGGRIELTLDIDFKALAGLDGGSFHANSYYIYGSDLSAGKIGNILTVSNIEAYDTLRLFNLWYQQEFIDGKVSLRFGQLAADDEFLVSDNGATFINGTFGWPPLTGANLPGGGPGYPLATPGIRLRVDPIEQVSLMAAVFDGDPGDSPGTSNPQKRDSSGTRIDFSQGAFSIFEADYRLNQEKESKGLPGTYKLGGFYATQSYPDVHTDDTGLSLADPGSSGVPRSHSGDWGIYFVADQMVWRKPAPAPADKDPKDMKSMTLSDKPSDEGLGLFWRVGGTPSNRNLIDFYTDGGFNYKGLFPGRDEDVLGLGAAYAHVSGDLSDLDHDKNAFSGIDAPVESDEMAIELTYQAKLAPWWVVQPDIQYIIHPGGNVPDLNDASGTHAIPNALVLGVRTIINF